MTAISGLPAAGRRLQLEPITREALQNLKSDSRRAPTLQSYQAFSKARDQAREVMQYFLGNSILHQDIGKSRISLLLPPSLNPCLFISCLKVFETLQQAFRISSKVF